jgi:hypothetical protein
LEHQRQPASVPARLVRLGGDDDDNKHGSPAWAVGAVFRGARCIHINHVCIDIRFHINPPSLRSQDILFKGKKHPVVCGGGDDDDDDNDRKPSI